MGRKRRKIVRRRVIKPPPKVFLCPLCNQEAVTVYHEKGSDHAKVSCGNCGVSVEVRWYPAYSAVDAYSEFYDIVTGAKKPIEAVASESSSEAVEGELKSGEAEASVGNEVGIDEHQAGEG